MTDVNEKLRLLETLREEPEGMLPVIDHAWRVFPERCRGPKDWDDPEVNIGWDAGLLTPDRPYFAECWAVGGITVLTYFVSVIGIEDAGTGELVRMLTDAGLFRLLDPAEPRTSVAKFEDGRGNQFFSINVTVGIEDETYIEGGRIFSFRPLNEQNSRRTREADRNDAE